MTLVLKLRGQERVEATRLAQELTAAYESWAGFIPAVVICPKGHRTVTAVPADYHGSACGCDTCEYSEVL